MKHRERSGSREENGADDGLLGGVKQLFLVLKVDLTS